MPYIHFLRQKLLRQINSQSLEDTQVGYISTKKHFGWKHIGKIYIEKIHFGGIHFGKIHFEEKLRQRWIVVEICVKSARRSQWMKVRGEARKYDGPQRLSCSPSGRWTLVHVTRIHFGFKTCLIWPWCAKMVKVWRLNPDGSQRLSCGAQRPSASNPAFPQVVPPCDQATTSATLEWSNFCHPEMKRDEASRWGERASLSLQLQTICTRGLLINKASKTELQNITNMADISV